MKFIHILLVLAIWLWPAAGQSQCVKQIYTDPKVEPNYDCPGPGEDALVPRLELKTSVELKVKQPAPWDGILMGKNRVLTLGLRIKALRRIRWQETVGFKERLEAEKKLDASMYQATINLRTSQRDNYKNQVVEARKEIDRLSKWYRSPTFWFATGFITAAAGATALAFGLRD
jgi:hypothetical protein